MYGHAVSCAQVSGTVPCDRQLGAYALNRVARFQLKAFLRLGVAEMLVEIAPTVDLHADAAVTVGHILHVRSGITQPCAHWHLLAYLRANNSAALSWKIASICASLILQAWQANLSMRRDS